MEYLIKQFKNYGIEDFDSRNYIQTFPLVEQESSGVELKIGNENFL